MTALPNATPFERLADLLAQRITSARGYRDLCRDGAVSAIEAVHEIGKDLDALADGLREIRAQASAPVAPRPAEAVSDSSDEEVVTPW